MIAEYVQVTGEWHQTLPRLIDRTADEFALSRDTLPRCEIDTLFNQQGGRGTDRDAPPEAAAGLLDRVLRAEALERSGSVLNRSGSVVQGRPQRKGGAEDIRKATGGVFVSVRRRAYAFAEP